jgi:hypothetical protein
MMETGRSQFVKSKFDPETSLINFRVSVVIMYDEPRVCVFLCEWTRNNESHTLHLINVNNTSNRKELRYRVRDVLGKQRFPQRNASVMVISNYQAMLFSNSRTASTLWGFGQQILLTNSDMFFSVTFRPEGLAVEPSSAKDMTLTMVYTNIPRPVYMSSYDTDDVCFPP